MKIYDTYLKTVNKRLHSHLKTNEVIPELHLTRWLRCVLSREFNIENCFLAWDYIFCGVHYSNAKADGNPFANLDFLCTAMILEKREDLLENEDSACLGILMSFKEPESIIKILDKA